MMNPFFAAEILGGWGPFGGAVFRRREDYREHYRERAGVGGFLSYILDSKEFNMFLSLLLFLIAANAIGTLSTAPVTSSAILLMIGLHFEKYIFGDGNTFIHANNFHRYSFHAKGIVENGQWHRLLTAPFLHSGKKLHLFLNMTALSILCWVEAFSRRGGCIVHYIFFFLALAVTSGLFHILLLQKYKKEDFSSYTSGFTGVIFALKAFANTVYRSGGARMALPLLGDQFAYRIPVNVPIYAEHFVELFLFTILFGEDSNFYANLGGIAAGYTFVAADVVMDSFGVSLFSNAHEARSLEYNAKDTVKSIQPYFRETILPFFQERGIVMILLLVITVLIYKLNENEKCSRGRTEEQQGYQQHPQVPTSVSMSVSGESNQQHPQVPTSVSMPVSGESKSIGTGLSDDDDTDALLAAAKFPGVKKSEDNKEEGISLEDESYDDGDSLYEAPANLPEPFLAAFGMLTANDDAHAIHTSLKRVVKIVTNATTKGQKKGKQYQKYRHIPLANQYIQELSSVEGTVELANSFGFLVKEDFEGDKFLVYPLQDTPEWFPLAIQSMLSKIKELSSADRESVSSARLKYFKAKEKKKKAAREKSAQKYEGYSAGMGGGDSRRIFYGGGT